MKRLPALFFVLFFAVFLAGCKKQSSPAPALQKRQVINQLPIPQRPFIALFPHSSTKLLTLYVDQSTTNSDLTVDIEYLSGDALKGGRTTVKSSSVFPYTQAFLLGSCSSGGKCSFDKDITTGSIKTKLELQEDLHILKSNFAFVTSDTATSDSKLEFSPDPSLDHQYIIGQTHGLLGTLSAEIAAEPVAITSDSDGLIKGTLTVYAPDASSVMYYNGSDYQKISATKQGDKLVLNLNLRPWTKSATITRDDLKGTQELTTLYLLGPFVPIK